MIFLLIPLTQGDAKEYIVRYQPLSAGSIYYIELKGGEKIGKVIRKKNKEIVSYSCLDLSNQILAEGLIKSDLPDTCVDLINIEGESLGSFRAEIRNLYPIEYKVFSKNILRAKGYMHWLGNHFALADPDNPKRFIVTYFRPMFKLFNDNWHFDVHDDIIHLNLLSVIGAFQTACDLNFEMLELKHENF